MTYKNTKKITTKTKKIIIFATLVNLLPQNLSSGQVFFTCSLFFFYFLNFFEKKCNFLCQNFGISKNCYIFVIQSNTEL